MPVRQLTGSGQAYVVRRFSPHPLHPAQWQERGRVVEPSVAVKASGFLERTGVGGVVCAMRRGRWSSRVALGVLGGEDEVRDCAGWTRCAAGGDAEGGVPVYGVAELKIGGVHGITGFRN